MDRSNPSIQFVGTLFQTVFGVRRPTMLIVGVSVALTSCTQSAILYPEQLEEVGSVQIYPDQSECTLPATQYYFYNMDGESDRIVMDGDAHGNFDGTLPVGIYRVIATNVADSRVSFTTMDSPETAIVRLPELDESSLTPALSRVADYTLLPQPGNIYSTVIESLVVSVNKPVRKGPSPVLLTKQLNFSFLLEDGLADEIAAMTGLLPGIYPAVHLYTHQGIEIENAPNMATPFETASAGAERTAQIYHFGLYDPAHGDQYAYTLALQLTMRDGSTTDVSLDLTDVFSDIMDENKGVFPANITIPIELTKSTVGVAADAGEWTQEGETVFNGNA